MARPGGSAPAGEAVLPGRRLAAAGLAGLAVFPQCAALQGSTGGEGGGVRDRGLAARGADGVDRDRVRGPAVPEPGYRGEAAAEV